MDVAYQGVPGAFSEEAAIALLGDDAAREPVPRFDDVFDAVLAGRARYGVVPVENTLAGSVHAVYDLLGEKDVRIVRETNVRVTHVLAAVPGATIEALRRVRSHPVALAQCESFFRAHPHLEPIAAYNTAGAIAEVMEKRALDEAAIGSRRAAERYGAAILRDHLEDNPENWTRFLLLGASDVPLDPRAKRKTSLVFTLAHRPGSLAAALRVFAERGIDLTKIESRPLRGRPFEYAFYVDVVSDAAIDDALTALHESVSSLRVFGSYAV